MYFLKKVFLHSWKKYIFILFLAVVIVLLNLISRGFDVMINYMDGFFIAGFSVILLGGLSVLNYFGAYDFASYAFSRRGADNKKMPYSDFLASKEKKRKEKALPFGPYFAVGGLFFLVSLTMYLIIYL